MAFVKGKADEIAKSINLRKKPFTVVCLRSSELIEAILYFLNFWFLPQILSKTEKVKTLSYNKCALEQVQAAVEQFGRSDTKHFLHIAPFSISSLEWNSYFMYYYIIVEKLSKNLRGRLQYWFPKHKIDVINFINDFLCFVGMFYRKNTLIFCNKIYNNILQCEYLYALP